MKFVFEWFDTSSYTQRSKVFEGEKRDCVRRFKEQNPSVNINRVSISEVS